MFSTYSIPSNKFHMCTEHTAIKTIIYDGLPFSLPWKLRKQTITNLIIEFCIQDKFVQSGSIHCDTIQCYFIKQSPETLDWKCAYNYDTSTSSLVYGLTTHKATEWTNDELKTVGSGYKLAMQKGESLSLITN